MRCAKNKRKLTVPTVEANGVTVRAETDFAQSCWTRGRRSAASLPARNKMRNKQAGAIGQEQFLRASFAKGIAASMKPRFFVFLAAAACVASALAQTSPAPSASGSLT